MSARRDSAGQSTKQRVVIADDDLLLREGLASLLERSDFQVVGQASDGSKLIELVENLQPDLAIVDIRMPPTQSTEGLEAAKVVSDRWPEVGVLVLSAHAEVEEALELVSEAPGSGYLLKSRVTDIEAFLDTVHRIAAGGTVVDPAVVQELVARRRVRNPLDSLSEREGEVLSLMAQGYSNAGIARRIFVTEGTVEKHVHSILAKLDLPETPDEHRRVLAVLAYLETR